MRVAYARDTASRMNFGKITLGALLLAIGVLLLAVRAGFAHPDTPLLLLRFWPLLLIAFGLAFLASVIKNPFMGCLAVLLILGGTALGMFWMNRQAKLGHVPRSTFSLDLRKTNAASLTVRVQTDVGRFYIGQGTPPTKTLLVRVRKIAGDSTTGYRFAVVPGRIFRMLVGSLGSRRSPRTSYRSSNNLRVCGSPFTRPRCARKLDKTLPLVSSA